MTRLDEVYAAYAEPDADFDNWPKSKVNWKIIQSHDGHNMENQLERALMHCVCQLGTPKSNTLRW